MNTKFLQTPQAFIKSAIIPGMDSLRRVKPLTWAFVIGWLLLVAAAYYYVYSAGWFNGAVQATSEMMRFQASLIQEEDVHGASVSIHNFQSFNSDSEDRRTLNVILNVTDACSENDDACKEFIQQIATKTLKEYPEIDSFTHLNIGIQQNKKLLLVINVSKTFNDSKTIEEWRQETQQE